MAREAKEGYRSRTFRFSDAMMDEVKIVAESEGRTVTAQMERFIWEKIKEMKSAEKPAGQRKPTPPARIQA